MNLKVENTHLDFLYHTHTIFLHNLNQKSNSVFHRIYHSILQSLLIGIDNNQTKIVCKHIQLGKQVNEIELKLKRIHFWNEMSEICKARN